MAAVPIADPTRRHTRRNVASDEIKSPMRAPDYVVAIREYRQISAEHFVQV
ncbi:hypothetical protein D3C73_1575040 [compost metagenome]